MDGFRDSSENFCHGSISEQLLKIHKIAALHSRAHPHTLSGAACAATGCNQAVTCRDRTWEYPHSWSRKQGSAALIWITWLLSAGISGDVHPNCCSHVLQRRDGDPPSLLGTQTGSAGVSPNWKWLWDRSVKAKCEAGAYTCTFNSRQCRRCAVKDKNMLVFVSSSLYLLDKREDV